MLQSEKMKALLYLRVSTPEQARHGYSLDSQEVADREFAERNGYEVVRVFREEGESGKSIKRTELGKLLQFISEKQNKIQAIIIWKFDRLARNLTDQLNLIRDLAIQGIRVLSVTEINEETAAGRLSRNIFGVFAQFENEVKAERTILNMKAAVQAGRWLWRPPIGYKRVIGSSGKTIIAPGPNADFIARAFEMARTGSYRQSEITAYLRNHGFPDATDTLTHRILANPLYCGIIRVPWFPDDIQGNHEAIVTPLVFEQVQLVLSGKNPAAQKKTNHPEFPLRRFVKCGSCETPITGGFCRGRHGGLYPYYFCRTRGCSFTISKSRLEESFVTELSRIEPSAPKLKWLLIAIGRYWKKEQSQAAGIQGKLSREIHDLERQKKKVDELMMREVFDETTYRERVAQIRNALTIKKIEYHEAQIDRYDSEAVIAWCSHFLKNLSSLWMNATLEGRQAVQNAIFPQGIFYTKTEGFRTPAISLLFKTIADSATTKKSVGVPTVIQFKPLLSEITRVIYPLKNVLKIA